MRQGLPEQVLPVDNLLDEIALGRRHKLLHQSKVKLSYKTPKISVVCYISQSIRKPAPLGLFTMGAVNVAKLV